MQKKTYTIPFGEKSITAEFNDLTPQTNGSVMLTCGETVILVTAVMGKENPHLPYFPLSVEFEEKFYAAGEILGSRFMRREGRPSDEAILSARIVDRTIRPLFPVHFKREVQVVVTVLAFGEDDPDVLAVIGASLALSVSDIPWNGPVGAVRIGRRHDGSLILNPTYSERTEGTLSAEVLSCGKDGLISMIETAAFELQEDVIIHILEEASYLHTTQVAAQLAIIEIQGKNKLSHVPTEFPENLKELYTTQFASVLHAAVFSGHTGKSHLYEVKDRFVVAAAALPEPVSEKITNLYFEEMVDETLHFGAVHEGKRADGRGMDDLRTLYAQAGGISPVLHGSGIFYRGETRIFSALTLGGPEAAQLIDTMEERDSRKRFMHHYNFPPFSVGESGKIGGFNRRMIGHGALAEKALIPVIPDASLFPYTIRLVSETMSSNGSSSMGSVCASTLALMDGGVPITRPVAGIASGVMFHGNSYALLTDIQGPEDEYGDMDFKVAGTVEGITAIQMDVKVSGIPLPVLAEALQKARVARHTIIKTLTTAMPAAREKISSRAPEITSLKIMPEQIGLVIGSGGKTINNIKTDTGVQEITIEEDGTIFITGKNGSGEVAAARIRTLTKRYVVGERLQATITKLAPFGAFAKLDAYHEGLIHISEIAPFRVETAEKVLKVGQVVPVMVVKVTEGKIGLSIKQADPDFIPPLTQ